jgi:hypothetical protein
MGYIKKDTTALLNTTLTDAGRQAISQGSFNISYFQVGDSEVCYDCIPNGNLSSLHVLQTQQNAQNSSPIPQKNKMNIKYPIFVDSTSGNTWGIPFSNPQIDNVFNTASPRGFFTGSTGSFSAFTSSAYTMSSNFIADIGSMNSGRTLTVNYSACSTSFSSNTTVGGFVAIYMDGNGDCSSINGNFPILTYQIEGITGDTTGTTSVDLLLDRNLPDFSSLGLSGDARVYFFPSGMTELYDTDSPLTYLQIQELAFETNCYLGDDVKVWNMNISWTESPAGYTANDIGYQFFKSSGYTGTKEYLGYNSDEGQLDTDGTYYFNSYSEQVMVPPSQQKAIAIIHYTNNAFDNFYGEKFAMEDFDSSIPLSAQTGAARHFNVDIPWLMWHKSTGATMGETFYVDPPGFSNLNLFQPNYLESTQNDNMNEPGIRYYHLWDTNPNSNGLPNRVGKVWPDLKIVTIDDDELVAALSYKSNRNWTLPAPKLSLIAPNTFNNNAGGLTGVLSGSNECLWVTYRFNNSAFTDSLHCNYYSKICGTDPDCPPDTADVLFKFGNEFPFLNDNPTGVPSGFSANDLVILAQKTTGDTLPDPSQWVEVTGITEQISATTVNGYLTVSGLTGTTLQITKAGYDGGSPYILENYIDLPQSGDTQLNFGGEYLFYGNIKTDIQATIYVMNYQVNLGQVQFMDSSNPTWTGNNPYVTEVGLYDSNKDLMIISKVQSPQLRQGVQQYTIKLDF